MKRTIILRSLAAVAAVLLLFCVVSAVIAQNRYFDAERASMRSLLTEASGIGADASDARLAEIVEKSEQGISAALFDSSGTWAAGSALEDRTALESARESGYGEDVLPQGVSGTRLYGAVKLLDGSYLMAAKTVPALSLTEVLILFAAALFTLAFIYFLAFANEMEKRIALPVSEELTALYQVMEGDYTASYGEPVFPEFALEQRSLQETAEKISETLKSLREERASTMQTLDSMSEGLVVMDAALRIVLINKSARDFFGVKDEMLKKNLLHLTHLPRIQDAARHAVRLETREVFDISVPDGRTLQILMSPVRGPATGSGVIMLVNDVTAMRRAEQIRSDFVANVSHEMKTPLTSIKGFTELLEAGLVQDPEQQTRYLSLIRQEADRMSVLISDILKLSELESVVTDTGKQPVSLKWIAQKVAESLALQAKTRDVNLKVTGDSGMLAANPDRMTELVLNLTDNALKYNNPGGSVEITVEQGQDCVILTVTDTGVGIPEEAKERVFERFYRVDKSRSRRQGGTGLGLSIVKHIVSLYKGEIRLTSKLGEGTAIRVTLPVE